MAPCGKQYVARSQVSLLGVLNTPKTQAHWRTNLIAFFVSVASEFAELAMSHGLNNSYCPTNMIVPHAKNDVFEFHPVCWAEVRKVIMALPSNKAPGYDKVPVSVIKYCLE